jgi:hypothetical protein
VALCAVKGVLLASKQLGIPASNLSRWCREPAASPVIAAVELDFAAKLEAAQQRALEAVNAALSDPGARLGEKAKALEVLSTQSQLANQRATSHSLVLNGTAQRDEDASRLPPELVERMHRAYSAVFEVWNDEYHGYPGRRIVIDGDSVEIEGELERPWLPDRLKGPQAGMVSSLPATFVPEAPERPGSYEPTITVRRIEAPAPRPPRRRLADRDGILR